MTTSTIETPAAKAPTSKPKSAAGRRIGRAIIFAAALIALVGGGGLLWSQSRSSRGDGIETSRVQRDRLMVTIESEGSVESANNSELKSQVSGAVRIISIVPDGTQVEKGAELVHLDRSGFEQQLSEEKIVYERAVADKIQAEQDYEAAAADVREYIEGSYSTALKAAESQVTVAQQNLETDKNVVQHTERMFRKGFVTALQLETDKFSVERGELDLAAALTSKRVLEQFTKPKTIKQLEAVRDAADARRRAGAAQVQLEKAKLERIQRQLEHCVIVAPQRGMVIYGNDPDQSRGSSMDNPQIEEGAMVRERQTIIRLPDLSNMQVKTTVHESRVPHVGPGMAARIKVQDHTWKGHVTSIANRPLPPPRYSAPVKNYAVFISIDGNTAGLKPGMTAQVEILLADLHDVYTVPVAAVVERDGQFYAWVRGPNGPQKRHVAIGKTDDRVIEIKEGISSGEDVIVDPRKAVPEATQFNDLEPQAAEDDSRFHRPALGLEPPKPRTEPTAVSQRAS